MIRATGAMIHNNKLHITYIIFSHIKIIKMNTNAKNQIRVLINFLSSNEDKIINDMYEICESLEYKESSKFSYNIDRYKNFINELKTWQ